MKLTLEYSQTETKDGLYAYALHIVASTVLNDDGDPHIFVYHRRPRTMNPFGRTDLEFDDVFVNIATPVDMEEVPEDAPDICHGMPYYRSDTLDLWFRNLEDVEQAKKDVDRDVASLCKLYNNMSDTDGFRFKEEKTYG
jgi:hypothetical protein